MADRSFSDRPRQPGAGLPESDGSSKRTRFASDMAGTVQSFVYVATKSHVM